MESKIRVLIADSSEDYRLLLSDSLDLEPDIEVIGAAGDGVEALDVALGVLDAAVERIP